MSELIDGYTPIYRVKMDKDRFGLTTEAANRQDLAEEYAVCADIKANAGLIVYGKYNGVWSANPWSTRFLLRDLLEQIGIVVPPFQITHFHSFVIKGVTSMQSGKEGWRIVGLWGDEEKGEGMRIGPYFEENEVEACEKLLDALEAEYELPVKIADIISHFTFIRVGTKLKTTDGIGVVEEIRPGPLPFLVRLENDGHAWQNQSNIISIINES